MEPPIIVLNVPQDFSRTPGGRVRTDGPFSGEELLEDHLQPAYSRAVHEDARLLVVLDGAAGYGTGFLDESFGGLAEIYTLAGLRRRLWIRCVEEPKLILDIWQYIEEHAEIENPPRLQEFLRREFDDDAGDDVGTSVQT